MKVGIVVPVHGAIDYVRQVMTPILREEVPVVIVDDASDPDTWDYLRSLDCYERGQGQEVALLRNKRQQLFTRTVNRGLRHLYRVWKPDAMAVVNTDCNLGEHWLRDLTNGLRSWDGLGIVGYPQHPTGKAPPFRIKRPPDYVTGHCMLLRTRMLEEVGVLCETDTDGRNSPELALYHGQAHIGSERILCWRAAEAGWGAADCHSPQCTHAEGKSWGQNLQWLHHFQLDPLWEPCDTLEEPKWKS